MESNSGPMDKSCEVINSNKVIISNGDDQSSSEDVQTHSVSPIPQDNHHKHTTSSIIDPHNQPSSSSSQEYHYSYHHQQPSRASTESHDCHHSLPNYDHQSSLLSNPQQTQQYTIPSLDQHQQQQPLLLTREHLRLPAPLHEKYKNIPQDANRKQLHHHCDRSHQHTPSPNDIPDKDVGIHSTSDKPNTNPETSNKRVGIQDRITISSRRQKRVTIDEVSTSMDDDKDLISSTIGNLELGFQNGVAELRQHVSNLMSEKKTLKHSIQTMDEQLIQLSDQRDYFHSAYQQLEEVTSNLKEQCDNHGTNNKILKEQYDKLHTTYQSHLNHIATQLRSRRLAHRTLATWRRRVKDRATLQMSQQLLEEENKRLREELLICQEAAKQAFLRSATVLNSEALSMFQDAATRRLGGDDTENEYDQVASESTVTSGASSEVSKNLDTFTKEPNQINSQHLESNKENDKNIDHGQTLGYRNRLNIEHKNAREHQTLYSKSDRLNRLHLQEDHFNLRSREQYGNIDDLSTRYHRHVDDLNQNDNLKHKKITEFMPDPLREETRACLQQLRDDRLRRPSSQHYSCQEPDRKTQRGSTICQDTTHHVHVCHCIDTPAKIVQEEKSIKVGPKVDTSRPKSCLSNKPRYQMLSNVKKPIQKKVIYRPSASTILIEKHIGK